MPSLRGRAITALALAATIFCGLASRSYGEFLPHFVATYAGDTLWALAAFLAFRLFWPNCATQQVALAALAVSLLVELSQLYHAPWIDAVRSYRLAKLILGSGFLWSDLVCYAVGVGLGAAFDVLRIIVRRRLAGSAA